MMKPTVEELKYDLDNLQLLFERADEYSIDFIEDMKSEFYNKQLELFTITGKMYGEVSY